MRKYILVALVLVVLGIGASFLLIPNETDVAVMQARDVQAIDIGNVDVEAEYAQGRRTFPIINAMFNKRVMEGKKDEAMKMLEQHVAEKPNDVQVRKLLAEQYQMEGDFKLYNEQLVAIAAADPTEGNLKVLADIYNGEKNYPKQIETLQKMIEVTNGSNPQYFADLATIQMVENRKEDALKTIEDLKARHPDFKSYTLVYINTTILVGNGKGQEAYEVANQWITANPNIKELTDLVNIIHYGGYAPQAVQLVEPRMNMLTEDPALVAAYVNACITAGKSDHAYDVLTKVDQAGKMTPDLYKPYIELAMKRQDFEGAETIAKKMDVTGFKEEDALNLLEIVRANQASGVFDALTARFGTEEVLRGKPVLAAVIAIAKNAKDQNQKIEVALAEDLTSTQRVRLAEACARADKMACFDTIVKRYPPIAEMNGLQAYEFTQIHILADRAKDIVDPMGELAKAKPQNEITKSYLRLASAAGRTDIMLPWIEANRQTAQITEMQEYFYISHDKKHYNVSAPMAEALFSRDPSPMNKDIMIAAYMASGQEEKALPILREMAMKDGSNDVMYLSALSKLGRKDAKYKKELADYAEASLKAMRGDDKQQLNYAYMLVANGNKDRALPYVKEYAKVKGGEWKKLYAQVTFVPKKYTPGSAVAMKAMTREQMIAQGNNPKASVTTKEMMAFQLMKAGHKADALKIYEQLAQGKGPESKEVKMLMFLWGTKFNEQQIAWIMNRAKTANAYDKQKWNEYVSNYGDDYAVVQYVSSTPDALYNEALRKKYFTVIAGTGGHQAYDTNMRGWVAQTTDAPALLDYAAAAETYGHPDAAFNAYQRVLVLEPNNEKALRQIGVVAFGKGRYADARTYFDRYFAVRAAGARATDPELVHYYRAQLYKQENNIAMEKAQYQAVVDQWQNRPLEASDTQTRYLIALMHLGRHDEAKRGFEELLAENPSSKGILADYMGILIEYKYFDDATRVANQYDKNSPYYTGRGAAVLGRAGDVSSIERLSGGREMKISFAQPIDGKSPLSSTEHSWIEKTDAAYDSVTISAKPGFVVRFVPTTSDQFAVVPAQAQSLTPQAEFDRQQDLRLQMLYARIEQETGQTDRARQRLATLQGYYPNDAQVLTYSANTEIAAGNTMTGIELLQKVQAIQPENQDIGRMINDLRKQARRNFVKIDHEYRSVGENDEQITTLSGAVQVNDRFEMGTVLKNDNLDTYQIRRASDGLIGNYDASRQQAEIYGNYYYNDSSRLRVSGFTNNDTPGAGLYYAFNNPMGGRTELMAEFHRPYWDFAEAVLEHANRDQLGVRHNAMINPTLSAGAEVSLNRYNLKVKDDVMQTGLIRASLMQRVNQSPYVGVGYGFDGEYKIGNRDRSTDALGADYYLFPLRTREVHFVSGLISGDITPTTHGLLTAGYAVDRFGENSPVVEGRITQDITDDVEAGVRARYGVQANDTSASATNIGAHLQYKF